MEPGTLVGSSELGWVREESKDTRQKEETPRGPSRAEFVWNERHANGESEEMFGSIFWVLFVFGVG